jgi:hypothetical protein
MQQPVGDECAAIRRGRSKGVAVSSSKNDAEEVDDVPALYNNANWDEEKAKRPTRKAAEKCTVYDAVEKESFGDIGSTKPDSHVIPSKKETKRPSRKAANRKLAVCEVEMNLPESLDANEKEEAVTVKSKVKRSTRNVGKSAVEEMIVEASSAIKVTTQEEVLDIQHVSTVKGLNEDNKPKRGNKKAATKQESSDVAEQPLLNGRSSRKAELDRPDESRDQVNEEDAVKVVPSRSARTRAKPPADENAPPQESKKTRAKKVTVADAEAEAGDEKLLDGRKRGARGATVAVLEELSSIEHGKEGINVKKTRSKAAREDDKTVMENVEHPQRRSNRRAHADEEPPVADAPVPLRKRHRA